MALAPSTMLRMVPLPRFAGEEKKQRQLSSPVERSGMGEGDHPKGGGGGRPRRRLASYGRHLRAYKVIEMREQIAPLALQPVDRATQQRRRVQLLTNRGPFSPQIFEGQFGHAGSISRCFLAVHARPNDHASQATAPCLSASNVAIRRSSSAS